jgi:hypothetical protein
VEGQGLKEEGVANIGQQQCLPKEYLTSWVGKLWQHDSIHRLSLKLDIGKDKWLKNFPMIGEMGCTKSM